MATLNLSPRVLHWAAGNIGLSLDDLAERIAAPSKKEKIVAGELTATQAQKLAQISRVPFGFLFLSEPPNTPKPGLPDLRQVHGASPLGSAFHDTLDDILRKQEWYLEYLSTIGADPPPFVGKYQSGGTPAEIAKDISKTLGIDANLRQGSATKEAYYSNLAQKLEDAGVLVFKNGVVRSSNGRPLPVSEFRGFAIADGLAPLIFINGQDAPAAWIFTLMHEAAHIWIGQSGVSDISAATHGVFQGVEKLCNQVAAEILTPKEEFLIQWGNYASEPILMLSRLFKVSQLVIARRALDFDKISHDQYLAVLAASAKRQNAESSGNIFNTIPVRSSKKLTNAILASSMSGRLMLRDAGLLLNVKPNTVVELSRRR